MTHTFLDVRNVTKNFGGLRAIDSVSFHIERGEIFSIIGPNGAGKTTLFNLITGFLPPTDGEIVFRGDRISGLKPYQIARKNIGRTFQLTTLFQQNTVLDNLVIGQRLTREAGVLQSIFGWKGREKRTENALAKAHELAEFVGLGRDKLTPAALLPHGAQKQLTIGLALAGNPELLLLDEPVGGVDMDEIDVIIRLIKEIRDAGVTVCLIEHKMSVVMNISNRILALSYGEKIVEDVPESVCRHEEVIKSYLGDEYVVTC
jgi:ABC-type branched-subunit amino acid transport system ATPase component